MSQTDQRRFNRLFRQRPILYQPGFAIIFDSPTIAIVLSQLLYWHGKGANPDGWIYKTAKDMTSETGLTRNQQDTAIRKLKAHGILETKRAQIPAKRHFRIDLERLEQAIPRLMESHKLVYLKRPASDATKQPSNTESTPKNTTEINTKEAFRLNREALIMNKAMPP